MGIPPIFLTGTQGERLRYIPLSPLLRFCVQYPAILLNTAGREYNPQIQISEKSQTKRPEIADSRKTKRPKIDKRTTPNKRHSNAIITL